MGSSHPASQQAGTHTNQIQNINKLGEENSKEQLQQLRSPTTVR